LSRKGQTLTLWVRDVLASRRPSIPNRIQIVDPASYTNGGAVAYAPAGRRGRRRWAGIPVVGPPRKKTNPYSLRRRGVGRNLVPLAGRHSSFYSLAAQATHPMRDADRPPLSQRKRWAGPPSVRLRPALVKQSSLCTDTNAMSKYSLLKCVSILQHADKEEYSATAPICQASLREGPAGPSHLISPLTCGIQDSTLPKCTLLPEWVRSPAQ